VGIGTNAPTAKLHIGNALSAQWPNVPSPFFITNGGTLGSNVNDQLVLGSFFYTAGGNLTSLGIRAKKVSTTANWTGTALGIGMDVDNAPSAGGSLWFNQNSVGIGTATPGGTLQIDRTSLGGGKVLVLNNPIASWESATSFNNYRYIQTASPLATDGNWKAFNVGPGGVSVGYPTTPTYGSASAMLINGNVGIGTTTPGAPLDVAGLVQSYGLELRAPGQSPYIDFSSDTSDYGARIVYDAPTDALYAQGISKFSVNTLEIRGGADIVEGFDSQTAQLEAGTLMVIDPEHPGQLMPSTSAYDSKVAGIVSGANGVNPGIKMGQDSLMDGKNPIAMTGRVYVKCTAANGHIKPGDLLTSSDIPGYAMKASDRTRAPGATVGKAMSNLDKDTGLVLVLVNLQ
jgi:hypothetical protein